MNNVEDIDDGSTLDPRSAATIVNETRSRATRELAVSGPLLFAGGGLVVLLGYGAIWLSVRDQHPYDGPSGLAIATLLVLVVAAAIVTGSVVDRATHGVAGQSVLRRRIGFSAIGIAYAGLLVLEAALVHAGASHAVAYGVFAAATPILATGGIYIANSATTLDWPLFGLGICLITIAAAGSFTGPRTVWLIGALAGGLGFWIKAVVQLALQRT